MTAFAQKTRWIFIAAAGLAGLAVVAAWYLVPSSTAGANPSSNSIMVVAPYWYKGTWVFDDPSVGLRREPFVRKGRWTRPSGMASAIGVPYTTVSTG